MYGDDIHLWLHHIRAEELHREAREAPRSRPARAGVLRARVGWTLVEVGLRLATPRLPQSGLTARFDH
ncbi:hypothetical protein HUF15_17640 [Streptomyces samsunensis]|uniref:Uncharacterized protein n=2 Tax=Streptomyces TaxID=1883 RepID=A0A2J7ZBV7_STRMQ|nr:MULTISPECIES: hypothetical protein [Streptomyces]MYU14684.1 hypothetical protein [Streptomyces sp. SID8361]AQA12168.1 hypothetical protein BV401_18640 [Streptomyces autolyticus]AUA13463.1 hypothetical protein CFP59_05625 [Streptomyces sp. M56]MCC4319012.1 hypothetical protein [Streptomyces malaysiensis]MCD9593477.1 hypothetical protein [Streptomyces sp. 8ZJF_21]